jgi:hypothetical protein
MACSGGRLAEAAASTAAVAMSLRTGLPGSGKGGGIWMLMTATHVVACESAQAISSVLHWLERPARPLTLRDLHHSEGGFLG